MSFLHLLSFLRAVQQVPLGYRRESLLFSFMTLRPADTLPQKYLLRSALKGRIYCKWGNRLRIRVLPLRALLHEVAKGRVGLLNIRETLLSGVPLLLLLLYPIHPIPYHPTHQQIF